MFLNNVAIAAAYAKCVHRDKIKKVAILDFDVHHGNGTQALVKALSPQVISKKIDSYFAQGEMHTFQYKPWLDDTDKDNVLFTDVHGYADINSGDAFYPGSGKTNIKLTSKYDHDIKKANKIANGQTIKERKKKKL